MKNDNQRSDRPLLYTFLSAVVFLSSCASPAVPRLESAVQPATTILAKALPLKSKLAPPANSEETVPIFIYSGRNIEESERTVDPFGRKRSRLQAPHLAVAEVGIERDPQLSSPKKKRRTAKNRVEAIDLYPSDIDAGLWQSEGDDNYAAPWTSKIIGQMDKTGTRRITVFVHGFNSEFSSTIVTAAEIYQLQGAKGAMLSFSWPSVGKLGGYFEDKNQAQFSVRNFRILISHIAKETGAEDVNIIAHSAGTPIVVNALREIRLTDSSLSRSELQNRYRINRVVLAAPDMDLMNFLNGVLDEFQDVPARTAIYTCKHDLALKVAGNLYGVRRLGRAKDRLESWEEQLLQSQSEVELIDVTATERRRGNLVAHNYFHTNPVVTADVNRFLQGMDSSERGLTRDPNGLFWTIGN
ncbi:MAG: alpha/beta hydrolase [Verrucomicrobiales bacterium]|nr:alpha/beta hydrolase [Verrucomicrobiales bacterium]